ncbi:MAG: hypothetical protein WA440_03730, partial [Ignavibacteriaceae bacterium]
MKIKLTSLLLFIILFSTISIIKSQTTIEVNSENIYRGELLELGIDPQNNQQVLDSLHSESIYTRYIVENYCRINILQDAIPYLKDRLGITGYQNNLFPGINRYSEKIAIISALIELGDTSLDRNTLKGAIDYLNGDTIKCLEYYSITGYLAQKYNDIYGWDGVKREFRQQYLNNSIPLDSYKYLVVFPLVKTIVRDSILVFYKEIVLNKNEEINIRLVALNYLNEENSELLQDICVEIINNSDESLSLLKKSFEIYKEISPNNYLDLIIEKFNSDTISIITLEKLIELNKPSVYKIVVDKYKSITNVDLVFPEFKNALFNETLYLLDESEPNVSFIDSLKSTISYFSNIGWIGNLNFINELDFILSELKSSTNNLDSNNIDAGIRLFRKAINFAFNDSSDITNRFIDKYVYNFLSINTYNIYYKIFKKYLVEEIYEVNPDSVAKGSNNIYTELIGTGFEKNSIFYWNENYILDYEYLSPDRVILFLKDSLLTEESVNKIGVANEIASYSNQLNFYVTDSFNPNLVVNLKNSLGNQIPASNVMYYEGGWKDAVNNGDGTFTVITTKPTVSIRKFYEYANQTVHNVPAQNNTYTFTTVNAAVELRNSSGNLIDQGTVQYYAGAWRSFGTTVNGVANKELLPINYSFRMIYEYVPLDKQQDISTNSTVTFSTVLCTVKVTKANGQPLS